MWTKEKVDAPTGHWDLTTTYYKGLIAVPYREDSSIYAASIAGMLLTTECLIVEEKDSKSVCNCTQNPMM